jgi:Zn-dependent M28 family amino/carboxypeptidase
VLVQPGHCLNRTVAEHAQAAGAVGLVIANPDWEAGLALRPTLLDPAGLEIPAVAVTRDVGLALADAASAETPVHLVTSTSVTTMTSTNVIAETPGGDPGHVVVLGAHLDGVIDGPGIDDNGSGAMTVLEIARRLAALSGGNPAWKVRVAFWTGEELGLRGSYPYADSLTATEREAIAAYLNFDMLGSPNGIRAVYDGATASNAAAVVIDGLFGRAFDARGLAWQRIPVASSDELRFDQLGVPVGGLFSGAGSRKTQAEAATFGGTAGEPYDPCYHLACDTVDNVDPSLLEEMARVAAWVIGDLASGAAAAELGG